MTDLRPQKKGISFKKMHGTGNDFILIDNRSGLIPYENAPEIAKKLCRRRFGIGADGLILIDNSRVADFKWHFYNADGSAAEMCGNGGRCAARFAKEMGIAGSALSFETLSGIIRAEVRGTSVKLELPTPEIIEKDMELLVRSQRIKGSFLNTGVPHFVHIVDDIEAVPVYEMGRLIRHHDRFYPNGTNVDFVEVKKDNQIIVRTYERGVEDETLACGTGAVASAIACAMVKGAFPPITVETWGGERLKIFFEIAMENKKENTPSVHNVFLKGETVIVYSGMLDGDLRIAVSEAIVEE